MTKVKVTKTDDRVEFHREIDGKLYGLAIEAGSDDVVWLGFALKMALSDPPRISADKTEHVGK